jgi:hypothetical protein
MRTAVRKQITSFETFFSTLCYEFCVLQLRVSSKRDAAQKFLTVGA